MPNAPISSPLWQRALDVMQGATLNTVRNLAQGAMPLTQKERSLAVLEWADKLFRSPKTQALGAAGATAAPESKDRLSSLINSVLPVEAAKRHYEQGVLQRGRPTNPTEYIERGVEAGLDTLMRDILPGEELMRVQTGRKTTGALDKFGQEVTAPMTDVDYGEAAGSGLLKLLGSGLVTRTPRIATAEGVLGMAEKAGPSAAEISRIRTKGEVVAAADVETASKLTGKPVDQIVQERFNARMNRHSPAPEPTPAEIFELPEAREIARQALKKDGGKALVAQLSDVSDPKIFEAVSNIVEGGGLDAPFAAQLYQKYGASAPTELAKRLRDTATYGGKDLKVFSDTMKQMVDEAYLLAKQGDKTAEAWLDEVAKIQNKHAGHNKSYSWFSNNVVRPLERTRIASMLLTPANFMRNMTSGVGIAGAQMFEHAVSGSIEGVVGKGGLLSKTPKSTPSAAYADLMGDFAAAYGRFSPKMRKQLDAIIESTPAVSMGMFGSLESGIATHAWRTGVKGTLKKAWGGLKEGSYGATVDPLIDFATGLNRLQEFQLRKLFFDSRLRGNIDKLQKHGIKNYADLQQVLEADPATIPEAKLADTKYAMADATKHALEQTFGYRPTEGFASAILDTYAKHPILTAVGPTFPRFAINQFRWQVDRSPLGLLEVFNPEARAELAQGLNGGFATRQQARQFGKAMAGMGMMYLAWEARNSDAAGPKYYQIKDTTLPAANGQPELTRYIDMRPRSPFYTYLAIADIAKSASLGQQPNLTPDEWSDLALNIRRMNDLPMFTVVDAIRSLANANPEAREKIWSNLGGSYFSSFFTPVAAVREMYGAATGDEGVRTFKDVAGNELVGQITQKTGGVDMPARISPFTGQPMVTRQEEAGLRQGMGLAFNDTTKLQDVVARQPSIQLSEIIGDHGSPEANRMMSKHIGQYLQTKLPDGTTVSDRLAENLSKLPLEDQRALLQKAFAEIREQVSDAAVAEGGKAFVNKAIKQQFESEGLLPSEQKKIMPLLVRKGIK